MALWGRQNEARAGRAHTEHGGCASRNGEAFAAYLGDPIGDWLYVIDGHHRLAAYDNAGWTGRIPVEVFDGTLTEAHLCALESNSKDKLAMGLDEKREAAWKITKEGGHGLSAKQTAAVAQISRRTVNRMRKMWGEINERMEKAAHGDQKAKKTLEAFGNLRKLTWVGALLAEKGLDYSEFDEENWRQKKANELVKKWVDHDIAPLMTKDDEITAIALSMLSGGNPGGLVECLASVWAEGDEETAGQALLRLGRALGPFDPHAEASEVDL